MKKITLLLLMSVTPAVFSQVSYLSTDFATSGETYTVSTASNATLMNFAASGANHNWDFSGLTAQSQATAGWDDPNASGYKLSWCLSHFYLFNCNSQFNSHFKLASQVMNDINIGTYSIGNIVEHSNVTAEAFSNDMRGMTPNINGITLPVTIDYDDPDEVYHFPITYNDSYTTTGHFNLDMNPLGVDFIYDLAVQRTNTVQGWGSLTTPMGTFPDVLKLKSVIQRTDQVTVSGMNIPIPTTTVSYQWFSKDYGIPVLQADGFELFGAFIPLTVKYIDQTLCLTPQAAFLYVPTADYNPETGSAQVAFSNQSTNYDTAEWSFDDGQTATGNDASHEFFCPGTHQVTLTVTNHTCQPATNSTVTLPVVVTDSQNALTSEVTLTGTMLTATRDIPGTTYQWIDCDNANAAIEGETAQSFTPSVSGHYAVMLDTNGCQATSDCMNVELLANPQFDNSNFQILPNPTTGGLHFSGNAVVKSVAVYNALGMLVGEKPDLSAQASGIYFVKVTTDTGTYLRKIVKQ